MKKRQNTIVALLLVVLMMLSATGWTSVEIYGETFTEENVVKAQEELSDILENNKVQGLIHLCDSYDVKESANLQSQTVVTVQTGKTVNVLGVEFGDQNLWYKVQVAANDVEYIGYVERGYLLFSNEALINWEEEYVSSNYLKKVAAANNTYADIEQFPESYRPYLYDLKKAHPNWNFVMFDTNLDWDEVVENEMYYGRSLISSSYDDEWKIGRYDNNWSIASEAAVEYYLDPRNYLNESYIFAMEQLTFNPSYQNLEGVSNVLVGTFMAGDIPNEGMTYAQAFYNIGSMINVSPYHLASRVKQEQGIYGTSPIISGTYPGFESLYNYFNIDASGETNTEIYVNGLTYARKAGWTTRIASLIGGSQVIGDSYILKFQDTLYLQKFDVDDSYNGLYYHQYMQNLGAPMSEAYTVKKAYTNSNSIDNTFSFRIPVYDNMPKEASPIPMKELTCKNVIPEGVYNIATTLDTKKSVEVADASFEDGANVQIMTYSGTANQQWQLIYDAAGYYIILNNNSGKALTVRNSGSENHVNVEQKEYNGSKGQQWIIKDLGNGIYSFVARCSGRYLDVELSSAADGTNVQMYQGDGTKTQKYKLTKVGDVYRLATDSDGVWKYFKNGKVDYTYTGLVQNSSGWWYVENGILDWTHTGLVQNEYGWWYVENGAINFAYTGLVENEYGWWCVQNGAINFAYTGLVANEYGWWYVENGAINFGYTGLVENEYGWWCVQNGAINFGYTGLAYDPIVGWWYVEDGAINFAYTGIASNEVGTWYVENGGVNFAYTGNVTIGGITYTVVNGAVIE